eukprot:g8361.t1
MLSFRTSARLMSILLVCCLFTAAFALAKDQEVDREKVVAGTSRIQLAILLDTSGSMNGLINQARTQLWKIVNELATAKRDGARPELNVALYEYGKSSVPKSAGYVRQIVGFTDDLDKISEELFALKTNGGNEYCGKAIESATNELKWTKSDTDLKLIFICGNEGFNQGPVDYKAACSTAIKRGITVNTIFCGPRTEGVRTFWQQGAQLADGSFTHIDQNRAVAVVRTPFDQKLALLSGKINKTYVAFGRAQERKRRVLRQVKQDELAKKAAPAAAASRASFKGKDAYKASTWDLVDALKEGKVKLENVKTDLLPKEMQKMTLAEKKAYLKKKAVERDEIRTEIKKLSADRSKFIAEQPTEYDRDNERRRLRWLVYWLLIAIAGGWGAASILQVDTLLSANDRSRWCTVRALGDDGTYQIDKIILDPNWDTIDKVRHEDHFYSSKPALLPKLVAGVYLTVQQVSDLFDGDEENGWSFEKKPVETMRAILLIVNLLPMLVALFVFACILERYAQRDTTRLFVMAAASLGTLLTTFLVTLNNHTVAAYSLIFALYPAMRIVVDGKRGWHLFALCGFFAAFVCTNELPAALFGVLMFLLLARTSLKQTAVFFVPAALVPLGAYFFANYEATGGFVPFYAYYGTEKYEYVYKGIPSYWMNPGGIDANTETPWVYFLHCTIGHHGLFSLTPVFLLTLGGWVWACVLRRDERSRGQETGDRGQGTDGGSWWQAELSRFRVFHWMGIVLTVVVLGFYLSRTENYNYGGNTAGLRWMFWLIPFWLIGMIPIYDAWEKRGWFRAIAVLFLVVSVFSATYSLRNPWTKPWLFALLERWEYIDYRTPPSEKEKPPPLTTWFRSLPKSEAGGKAKWVRFEGYDESGNRIDLTLTDRGVREEEGRTIHRIEAKWKRIGWNEWIAVYDIDEAAFQAGKRPAHFLLAVKGESRETALTFLRGMPRPRGYNIGGYERIVVPLKSGGEEFGCRKAASRVRFQRTDEDRPNWYRCDTWLSDRIPFGVVQYRITVRDGENDDLLSARLLFAVEAAHFVAHRQAEIALRVGGENRFGQSRRFAAKQQNVAGRERRIPHPARRGFRQTPDAGVRQSLLYFFPTVDRLVVEQRPVIHAGPADVLFIEPESQRTDEPQLRPDRDTGIAPAAEAAKPHIVFMMADDLGWKDVGFHGGRIATPNIDALARRGVELKQFYVQPVCSPTRAALMTGRYPMRYGLQCGVVRPWAKHGLPLNEKLLPELLRSAGYTTAVVGKWHLGHLSRKYLPTSRGFDRQYGHYNGALDYFTHKRDGGHDWHRDDKPNYDKGYTTDLIGKAAADIIAKHDQKKPLFLYVPFNAPHTPLQAPEKYLKKYAHFKLKRRQTFAAMVTCMDDAVGRIVSALDAHKYPPENTLIVFCSDNGGITRLGSNGKLRAGKGTLYEGGVRVPAVMVWKGKLPAGGSVDEPLHMVDMLPTLAGLAGGKLSQTQPLDGVNVWPAIVDQKKRTADILVLNVTPFHAAIRVGDWKLIHNGQVGANATSRPKKEQWELFNLKDDPYEKRDRAGDSKDVLDRMKQQIAELRRTMAKPNIPPNRPPQGFKVPKVWGETEQH